MPTEQQVAAAALAAMNAGLPASVRAYDPSAVPATRPAEYVVVTLVRRFGGAPRAGRYARTGWALYLMGVSRVSSENARKSLQTCREALESQTLTVDGAESTPVAFADARAVAPDDGWLSGVNTYHFAI